jgi:hypothetical protein
MRINAGTNGPGCFELQQGVMKSTIHVIPSEARNLIGYLFSERDSSLRSE